MNSGPSSSGSFEKLAYLGTVIVLQMRPPVARSGAQHSCGHKHATRQREPHTLSEGAPMRLLASRTITFLQPFSRICRAAMIPAAPAPMTTTVASCIFQADRRASPEAARVI